MSTISAPQDAVQATQRQQQPAAGSVAGTQDLTREPTNEELQQAAVNIQVMPYILCDFVYLQEGYVCLPSGSYAKL